MKDINQYIGSRIRNYRKMKKMTILELADVIHKSKATVSKYETGDIALDVQTLYEIAEALNVNLDQLTNYHPQKEEVQMEENKDYQGKSPFYQADRLFFYFYDGRYDRLKEAMIDIHKNIRDEDGCYEASMSIQSTTKTGRSSEIYYTGNVLYSDMLIRFSFLNQYNKLEQDLLYIFNPLELRAITEGLLCGISSTDLMPCAFKCLVMLQPCDDIEELKKHLILTNKEMKRWQKMNMFIVDNNG